MDQIRVKSGALLAALVSGALAAGALGGAPSANATCASFFGIGNSAQCTSTLTTFAIAIGNGASATAGGLFGGAFAIGSGAKATTADAFTFATAVGGGSTADAEGLFGIAASLGGNTSTATFGSGKFGNLGLNIALSLTGGASGPSSSTVTAAGIGNIAANLIGDGNTPAESGTLAVSAEGIVNIAANLLGNNNSVSAGGKGGGGNVAFSVYGLGNTVTAGPGPLAIAGSIAQVNNNAPGVVQSGPGISINGLSIGAAAAVHPPEVAAASHPRKSAPAATAVAHHSTK